MEWGKRENLTLLSVREPEHEMASPDLWHTCRICRHAFFETMKPEAYLHNCCFFPVLFQTRKEGRET